MTISLRTVVAIFGLVCTAIGVFAAQALAGPVESFHSPNGKFGCTMYRDYDANRNSIRCGTKHGGQGLGLGESGKSSKVGWRNPKGAPSIRYNQVLYVVGGTFKVYGDNKTLRCVVRRRSGVTCRNGAGHGFTLSTTARNRF